MLLALRGHIRFRYLGVLMDRLAFDIVADGFEPLGVNDMGEGCVVLSQANERGEVENISLSREQLIAVLAALELRYAGAKNTEPQLEAA